MSARHLRAAGTLVAGLALLAVVAWQSGAKAVHYASDPTHEPCPALTPGDHTLTIDTAQGRRQVLLHAPRGAYKPRPLIIALHGAGQTATEFANSTGFSRLADREDFLVAYSPSPERLLEHRGARPARGRRLRRRRPRLRHRRVERRRADGAAGVRSVRAPRGRGVGGRRLSDAAAVHARAPAAGARDPRHRRAGLPLRRHAARLQGQREAVAGAVAAHRRLPRERSTG